MTELEAIDRDIRSLKELIRVAWKQLANSSLTPYERRETRNRIMVCSDELRRHMRNVELHSVRKQSPEQPANPGRVKPQLRLLPEGY
jgi:hypothetical protein